MSGIELCTMEKKKYTTNLRCGGCLAAVKPLLDAEPGIAEWWVDLDSEDKELTVLLDGVDSERVKAIFAEKGYEAKEKKAIFKNIFG